MNTTRRIHDGIVGAVMTLGVALGYYHDPLWLLLPGFLGVTLAPEWIHRFLSGVLHPRPDL